MAHLFSEVTSPLSKRRRFTPQSLPAVIPAVDNSDIEHHTFDSPLILQLCEQAPLPEEIEAQLLHVGMRVRKSVNDGYKTTPQKKSFTPRPFFNAARLSPETQAALTGKNNSVGDQVSPINNMQPLATATFCGISLAALSYRSDDWSNPEVAQQKLWSYTTSHKRGYENDSDSDDSQEWQPQTPNLIGDAVMAMPVDYFNIDTETMSDVSPMTQVGEQYRRERGGRRVAQPKSRVRSAQMNDATMAPTSAWNPFANMTAQQAPAQAFAQSGHNRMLSCGMEVNMATNDFGEAAFLAKPEDVEMDCS